ncbi:MAG: phosphoribosyl-AMP cyclohydrolase [Dissulfurimicrobium sp.]|uniref:phosphoribosyl-AMP cyclohydrolase n=1 Tax=Dissulfurimicrobium TaxID=1769732 RepID=UPI001EDC8555|nr:phosphoribosyl-AMP cyclohydrolase [Dissulfurimicrobium hydrothermale]UKL14554.1 phosphoribosyl-AMP cyclohydrolase [Dissulfurimicrobium hydrothermale]
MKKALELDFDKGGGLLPVIAQDWLTGEVLMLAYMNRLAWEKTLETGHVHYWSRSRGKLWLKGETSGHIQILKEAYVDCDYDAILVKVEQIGGAACHTGFKSCFHHMVNDGGLMTVGKLVFDPKEIYAK